jgi:antitoxin component of MazEF toxin-antitoxin module
MTEKRGNAQNLSNPKKITAKLKVKASKELEEQIANELACNEEESTKTDTPEVSNANSAGND